jgi:hypothetical protein
MMQQFFDEEQNVKSIKLKQTDNLCFIIAEREIHVSA